jgi:hypothetical protein
MTVCIAALCDGGRSCVVAADRMVVQGQGSLENKIENHLSKIHTLSPCSVLLHSGSRKDSVAIVEAAKDAIAKAPSDVRQSLTRGIDSVVKTYRDLQVLRRLGPTFDYDTLVGAMAKLSTGPLYDVWKEVWNVDLGEMILVSPNNKVLEIWYFRPTQPDTQCEAPYAAVGTGTALATTALLIQQYTKELPVSEALFEVYSAKKAAELRSYGLGEATDMTVLMMDGLIDVKIETLDLLEEYRLKKMRLADEQLVIIQKSFGP